MPVVRSERLVLLAQRTYSQKYDIRSHGRKFAPSEIAARDDEYTPAAVFYQKGEAASFLVFADPRRSAQRLIDRASKKPPGKC